MNYVQIIFFAIKMLWEYGPKLWKLGKEIYDKIEQTSTHVDGSREAKPLTSDQKAKEFNRQALNSVARYKGYMPKRTAVNEFRENVWKYRNPNATPKELSDARLRAGW